MNESDKKTVLIVDDEPIVRESLRDWLTASGYKVVLAESGNQALKLISENNLGVVVLDIRMPGKDGITTLKEAKENNPDLKYIFISGYPSVETMTTGIRLGAVGFLVKPFDPEELLSLLDNLILRQQQLKDNSSKFNEVIL